MLTAIRAIRASTIRDRDNRIRAVRELAANEPRGIASYLLTVVLWEEGEIEEAHQLAMGFLEENSSDFDMLVICLDYHIRANDGAATLEFARRVATAERIRIYRPVASTLAALVVPVKWITRVFKRVPAPTAKTDPMDAWAQYAREYVELHSRSREE